MPFVRNEWNTLSKVSTTWQSHQNETSLRALRGIRSKPEAIPLKGHIPHPNYSFKQEIVNLGIKTTGSRFPLINQQCSYEKTKIATETIYSSIHPHVTYTSL